MAFWRKLHRNDGSVVFVNVDRVDVIDYQLAPYETSARLSWLKGADLELEDILYVRESPEEVLNVTKVWIGGTIPYLEHELLFDEDK